MCKFNYYLLVLSLRKRDNNSVTFSIFNRLVSLELLVYHGEKERVSMPFKISSLAKRFQIKRKKSGRLSME